MVLEDDQESELIMCGDPKHACIFFYNWPREQPDREVTACIHSTSAKSLQGNRYKAIDSIAVACVWCFRDFIICCTNTIVTPLSSSLFIKTRPTLSQVCAGSSRSNLRGAVRDAEAERSHPYLVYFFQFLPLLLLQEPKRFSSCKITESWLNRKPVNDGRGDGLKAGRPADALLWRSKDLGRNPPK